MELQSLSLKNFGSIKEADLQFQNGFNIIVGDIGQGKSHMIYSIAYLLLNVLQDSRVDNYVNWGATGFFAELAFTHKGKNFITQSIYENGSNSRYVKVDNYTYDDITSALNTLKGYFDPARCKAAMISFQGDTDIVSSTPAVRRDNFRKIYDLEFSSQIKELENDIQALKEGDLVKLQSDLLILTNKEYNFNILDPLPFSEEQQILYVGKVEILTDKIAIVLKQIEDYDKQILQLAQVTKLLKIATDEHTKLSFKITTANKEIEDNSRKLTYIDDDGKEQIYFQNEVLDNKDFEVKLRGLQSEILDLSNIRIPAIDPKEFRLAIKRGKQDHTDLVYKEQKLQDKLELIIQGKCPTCERDFESVETDSVQIKEECAFLKTSIDHAEIEIEKFENKLLSYEAAVFSQVEVDNQRQILQLKIDSETNDIAQMKLRIETAITQISEKCIQDKKLLSQGIASTKTLIAEYKNTIESKDAEILILNAQFDEINALEEKPEQPVNLENEKEVINEKITSYNSTIIRNELYIKQNEALTLQKTEDEKTLIQKQKDRDKIINEIQAWEEGVTILKKDFPNYVIRRSISRIEDNTNLFLDQTYDGRYHIKIVEDKTGIGIQYGSKDKDIRVSSGGEQDLFNLGLKHGFCRLTDLGILILDEVDKFISLSQSRHLFSVLNGMLIDPKNEINQILIITHKDEIKELLELDFNAKVFKAENNVIFEL